MKNLIINKFNFLFIYKQKSFSYLSLYKFIFGLLKLKIFPSIVVMIICPEFLLCVILFTAVLNP